ncbi:unnamed protein product, partial [Mesorhabditis belari]|uniref:Uncharacterized protein n=1 Tax=Mesorhabditis belari TaxID=2138241 RepID=A0AAF3F780_9BILA
MGSEQSALTQRETPNIILSTPIFPKTTPARNLNRSLFFNKFEGQRMVCPSCTEPDGDSLLAHLRICDEHFLMRHGRGYHQISAQELHRAILKEALCSHCIVEHSNCGQKTNLLTLAKLHESLLMPMKCTAILNRMDYETGSVIARATYERLVEQLKWVVDTDLESRDVDRHFDELGRSFNKLEASLKRFEEAKTQMVNEMTEIQMTTFYDDILTFKK